MGYEFAQHDFSLSSFSNRYGDVGNCMWKEKLVCMVTNKGKKIFQLFLFLIKKGQILVILAGCDCNSINLHDTIQEGPKCPASMRFKGIIQICMRIFIFKSRTHTFTLFKPSKNASETIEPGFSTFYFVKRDNFKSIYTDKQKEKCFCHIKQTKKPENKICPCFCGVI